MRCLPYLALLSLVLAACSPTMIVLRQPESGQIAECSTQILVASVVDHIDDCAEAYKQKGYEQQIP